MPIGIERLNARHQQPNSRILFIKPLPGPTSALAKDYLERIAAITHPLMKSHHLSITTLEEYAPNPEFAGRNFNAGEVIQLVLRRRDRGQQPQQWLPLRHVQMVMIHELAHCQHMNHSGAFWTARNGLAAELRALWDRGYTGDGFWGRGATSAPSLMLGSVLTDDDDDAGGPRHLCGGTFRRRGGGRKRKRATESTAAAKERRVRKRFGGGGVVLGDDVGRRCALEGGRRVGGRPRVAGSVRGRQLRAAAALGRVEGGEEEEDEERGEDDEVGVDVDGMQMVRVCGWGDGNGDEEGEGKDGEREREEVRGLLGGGSELKIKSEEF